MERKTANNAIGSPAMFLSRYWFMLEITYDWYPIVGP